MPPSSPTGISVTCKFPLTAFLIAIFKPTVEIDGAPQAASWSTNFFATPAGPHQVTVLWKYLWVLPVNRATTTVTVVDGAVTTLSYKARLMLLLPGKLAVQTPAAAPTPA